jgi:hypothetical protein
MKENANKFNKEDIFFAATSGMLAIAIAVAYFNSRDQARLGREVCAGVPGTGSLMYEVDKCAIVPSYYSGAK